VGIFFLSLKSDKLQRITLYLVSLSAGSLLGGSFIHLIPEMFEQTENINMAIFSILIGILIFFILEKVVCWRHCHIPTSQNHPHPFGMMNLIGDSLHNFLDGVVIAGSFLVSPGLGLATTLAVIIHEIPQEIGDFGVLIHAGYTRAKALFFNFITALTAVLGAAITIIFSQYMDNLTAYIIPITAGGFIYIATADLIPELRKDSNIKKSILQLVMILLGIGLMYALGLLE